MTLLLLLLASQGGLIGPATGAETAEAGGAGAGGTTLLAQATPESRQEPIAPEIPEDVERWFAAASQANDNGEAAEALRLHQKVMAWVQANLPRVHPYRAKALKNLGIYLSKLGRRQEALAPTLEALELYRELARSNPAFRGDLAGALNNLDIWCGELGWQQALARWCPPRRLILKATDLVAKGTYAQAEPLRLRILSISEKMLVAEDAKGLSNLAFLYANQGLYRQAEPLYKRALAIAEKAFEPNDLKVKIYLISLGNSYRAQGRLGDAEALYKRALAIQENQRYDAHLATAMAIGTAEILEYLAELYRDQGRFSEAELFYKRKLAIAEEALGLEHPYTVTSLENLAVVQLLQGASPESAALLARLNQAQATWLRRELPLLPRERRIMVLDHQTDATTPTFALLHQDPGAAPLALEARLNRQGLLAEIERLQALVQGSSPETRRLAEQVADLDRQLASSALPPERRERLWSERRDLEEQLYRLLPPLKLAPVTTTQVAAALRAVAPQGTLLEFQQYKPLRKSAKGQEIWGASRYLALLLRPDGTIRSIPLGEAAPIDAAVAAAVAASADPNRQAEAPQLLAQVSALVLAPLQQQLNGVSELFVSPDGELNRLPFAALPLPAADGTSGTDASGPADAPTLGDTLSLRVLTTGRDLLRLQQPAQAGGPAVLIANPDFNAAPRPAAGQPAATTGPARRAASPAAAAPGAGNTLGNAASGSTATDNPQAPQQSPSGLQGLPPWQPLTGTEQEAHALAPLLGVDGVISGSAATSSRVLAQRSPRILHIATHGFFLADPPPARPAAGARSTLATAPGSGASPGTSALTAPAPTMATPAASASAPAASTPDDPLQRSGLVLAGANRPQVESSDDGYLTAAEATAMDLEGTELVTLSACETGVGSVRSGEGVYGLQRSLAVAGARSTLLSLWKVDDGMTATFMERFYSRLRAGEGRADALRSTQAEFRNHKNSTYNDIRVWGAFQLSGDWRPLPRW